MVTLTILYSLSENQSPNRSNGERRPLSPAWQGLRAPVTCAPLVRALPYTVDSAGPRSGSADGSGLEREGVGVAAANASVRDRGL